jgi:glutathione S-transferase
LITLYHFPRAICAQKVRVALAEKGLTFGSRIMTIQDLRSPGYLAINPNGYVPTLVHDGAVITESRVISEYIEDTFPSPSLLPAAPTARAKIRSWTKQIDDSLHLNVYVLTFVASFRKHFLARPHDVQERGLPLNFIKRTITLDLAENGARSGYYLEAVKRFGTLLEQMDFALSESEWLAGDTYSLADADFTPYLRRLEELGYWELVRGRYSHVERWFAAVSGRPSYQTAIRDWETESDRIREAAEIEEAKHALASALAA